MVSYICGGNVTASEQQSCSEYLTNNINLNNDIINNNDNINKFVIESINWNSTKSYKKFDVIIGCDITFDYHNFPSIFSIFQLLLNENGIILLCHDDDACPMSPQSRLSLFNFINNFGYFIEDIEYKSCIPSRFYNDDVKMWKIMKPIPITSI